MSKCNIGPESISGETQFKPIAFPFTKSGFKHELIKRAGLVCLVQRTHVAYPEVPAHFEVVKLRQRGVWTRPITGELMPACEVYPDAEQWGENGFTYNTLDAALSKFDSLLVATSPRRVSGRGRYHDTAYDAETLEAA